MQVYLVGGAVRDGLLGLCVQDRDWVVVGATPAQMLALGYSPVGKDFPVFLHPQSHEEYALARTERKTAVGYHGFQFNTDASVTLEQDLARRDLSINAMAQDADGNIIDPYGGQADLQAGILRHVSTAFAEDPVRILRVARFAARYNYCVAAETLALMQQMVSSGEVDALVAERVWQELSRALSEPHPQRFFEVLQQAGALAKILPELAALYEHTSYWSTTMQALILAAKQQRPVSLSYALMCVHVSTPLTALHQHLRVPKDCADAADVLQAAYPALLQTEALNAETVLTVFQRCDVWRRPERWQAAWEAAHIMTTVAELPPPQAAWQQALSACLAVDVAAIAATSADKATIPLNIRTARLQAISLSLASTAL
ncbi:multifunctional CCA tRNA nucleotidyl transferase/2'3'-cyclic phosphodiesterase/2'nucleotidase/phosphatase [Vitreoscilla massiliensis]|uniref:Multifunctional CCA tRNA nucleotidyl transferase/2'3'-cyclic phosphodiesterase/2'nucleotidase/phosphatase n=1 Tax=Vitreoscilla massiliensis TaxID=1689272 RepID=A0ABY4E0A0_9NEIS|nr:CCA tRNA nucleotidyltransferase [Vitreoscilla massiliensis]UOO89212.1 multifunctional CCA tRNA nucleotidyl transferase/2'3'-cyclic phosphodiesterase/2'nucleotidase/phosphatase [Vitreoscilla massiliensis]